MARPRKIRSCAPRLSGRTVELCAVHLDSPGPALRGADDACRVLSTELANRDRESIVALHLDAQHRVIGTEEVARGTIDGAGTSGREVFKGAILSNASALIIAHNHPSGNAEPSPEDHELTKNMVAAGKLLGIRVLDHLVVAGPDRCSSAAEKGTLGGSLAGYALPTGGRRGKK